MDRRQFLADSLKTATLAGLPPQRELSPQSMRNKSSQCPARLLRMRSRMHISRRLSLGNGDCRVPGRRRVERRWQRRVHLGSIYPHRRQSEGRHDGDVTCDEYHRYREDIGILKQLHQKSYRFSISWPRIQPTGVGAPNSQGLDHYSRLVDALLEANIRPFCTIYHWDLPQALEDRGGWPNRDLAGYYADYAGILAKHLGDRITVWAPFNMPWSFTYMDTA